MKTIEEKAKAYDEALERAKQVKLTDTKENVAAAEYIFPELAESEDERIRKQLIAIMNFLGRDNAIFSEGQITKEQAIAYLERQKEQKPTLFVPKFHVGDKVISTRNEHLTYEILEVGHINELGNPDYQVEIFDDGKRGVNGKFPNESPNIKYIECQKMDEWGKLLSEQKPAEWSEEDEKHINNILDIIDYWKATTHFVSYQGSTIDADINWLKSLRPQPHWKPSEEQMKVLKEAVAYFGDSWISQKQKTLESLYNDLLKQK